MLFLIINEIILGLQMRWKLFGLILIMLMISLLNILWER